MKPNSVHLVFKKGEEQWGNKKLVEITALR